MTPVETEAILGIIAAFLPLAVAYIKKLLNERGVSDKQVDAILDIADAELAALELAFPNAVSVSDARLKLMKARMIWNDPNTTVDDLKEFTKVTVYRTLKTAP